MIVINKLQEIRQLPDCAARRLMEAQVALCHRGDKDFLRQMEVDFDGPLGGCWYLLELPDDPRTVTLAGGVTVDLLSEEWNWCDAASLDDGCYLVFWGINNAGGPCLFVPDECWLSAELRARLESLVSRSRDQEAACRSQDN